MRRYKVVGRSRYNFNGFSGYTLHLVGLDPMTFPEGAEGVEALSVSARDEFLGGPDEAPAVGAEVQAVIKSVTYNGNKKKQLQALTVL